MDIQDIINEVRRRTDASNIEDEDIIRYVDGLNDNMGDSLFPLRASYTASLTTGTTEYDIPSGVESERIKNVYINGKKVIRKYSPDDLLDGWYVTGTDVVLSSDLVETGSTMMVTYQPHDVENYLAAPEAYRELYVYYVLACIANRDGDEVGYANNQNSYNGLLSEAISTVTKSQAYPKFTK